MLIAIGNMAVGGLAIGGLACGLFTVGGFSFGLFFALGGAAIGFGVSVGGFAAGSVAIGGAAFGLSYALGGAAFGPSTIDGRHCDPAAVEFFRHWVVARACRAAAMPDDRDGRRSVLHERPRSRRAHPVRDGCRRGK